MKCFTISNLEELKEAVKWKYLFLRSDFQFHFEGMDLGEAKEWGVWFNREFKSNGNCETIIVALAFALLFAVSLLIAHTSVVGTEIKFLGIIITIIGAVLGKFLGLIQARMRLRYLAELLAEEVNLRKANEFLMEKEIAVELVEFS